jgi:cytochrome P450
MSDMTSSETGATAGPSVADHVPAELVYQFDHMTDPAALADPFKRFDTLREQFRIFYSPAHGGFWVLTRYADIHDALQHPELFSSFPTALPTRENGEFMPGVRALPISLDPPEHTKYRKLLNQPFSPGRIRALEDSIRQISRELVDAVARDGECDVMWDVARPLPTRLFVHMLGLPPEEWKKFADWAAVPGYAGEEIVPYLREVVAQRKVDRRDDLISLLFDSEVDGVRLTDDEVLAFSCLLFTAGLGTTKSAIGWFFQFLAEHPSHRQQLLDDPLLIVGAVEELLRYYGFVQTSRTATDDFEFAGTQLRRGDRVLLLHAAANRDPRAFPDPHEVDFTRSPNRQITFAVGPHRCVGAHLARLELRVILEEFHRQIPNYQIAPGTELTYHGHLVWGVNKLPLVFG